MADQSHSPGSDAESQIEALLSELSLSEKISLLSGKDFWSLRAIERVGISSLRMSDGPTGLRSTNSEPATVFPVAVALASAWDRNLTHQMARAIGREAKAHGVHVLLAPGVNIQRTPLGGRNFEYYSEDPYLTSEIGIAFVDGVQSENVGTSVKHFVANNQEHNRMSGSSNVNERTLREIYLSAFEPIIKRANPWTVMCAYNRINGVFAAEHNQVMNIILKQEWGYDGVVVSDWGAAKSTIGSATGGLDLEMPGPGMYYGAALQEAVEKGHVGQDHIDDHVRRVLRLLHRCGLLKGQSPNPMVPVDKERQRTAARAAASAAIVLLKNDDECLPVRSPKKVAVIGTLADAPAIQGGGSSQVSPDRIVTPLEGLRQALPTETEILFERGFDPEPAAPTLDGRLLKPNLDSNSQGLCVRYFNEPDYQGEAGAEEVDWHLSKLGFGDAVQSDAAPGFSAEWTGFFTPRHSGLHSFDLTHANPDVELILDDQILVGPETARDIEMLFMILPINKRRAQIELEAGKSYPIKLRYSQPHEGAMRGFSIFNVGLREPEPNPALALQNAAEADQVILFVGSGQTSETEGEDRASMRLSDDQNAFIDQVLIVNPNTAIIVNSGGPIEMPWAKRAKAIVQMWLPGQEGGHAIADLLSGRTSPSGKLPVSFPLHYEDNPTYLHYPGGQEVDYGEGLFVGYRYYDKSGVQPAFPFGHGLSYTRFEYSKISAPSQIKIGEALEAKVTIKNIGERDGSEIVQLYVENLAIEKTTPLRQLRAFDKVQLDPGEDRTLQLHLNDRAFAWYDRYGTGWTITPGKYRLHIGASSQDIRGILEVELTE